MRSLSTCLLFVACSMAALASTTHYNVTVNGQKLGTGTVDLVLLPNGSARATIGLKINFNGIAMESTEEHNYAKDGMPITFNAMRNMTGTGKETMEYRFGPKSLTVKTTKGGKTTSKTVPYPATGTVKSVSTFWFVTTTPKVGATDTSWNLSEKTQKWEASTTKYTGDKEITVGGKKVKAHVLTSQSGTVYADEKSIPYRMEINESGITIVLERS